MRLICHSTVHLAGCWRGAFATAPQCSHGDPGVLNLEHKNGWPEQETRELASGGTMRLSRARVVSAWPGCPSSTVRGVPVWLSPQTYVAFCRLGGTWISAAWADRPRRACVRLAARAC